jgi:hypothetical protein
MININIIYKTNIRRAFNSSYCEKDYVINQHNSRQIDKSSYNFGFKRLLNSEEFIADFSYKKLNSFSKEYIDFVKKYTSD